MKLQLRKDNLMKDIFAGVIVALVSIPISMGYAQVAGLPAVYGLYGSVLPILLYGLFTSSPQLIFGVDATPAALVGGALASFSVVAGSKEALELIPVITIATACWLLIFSFVKAGRLVNYISKPVMGGFISGIGCTIILMQLPKLFGGSAGTGEVVVLIINICEQMKSFNGVSAVLGIGTVLLVLLSKKWFPKFPMSVVMMIIGACLGIFFDVEKYGVIYGGVQKNVGPAGVVIAIVREDLITDDVLPGTPTMLRYKTHADAGSLFNTPPAYGIYICGKVFKWLKNLGGLEAVKAMNEEKAAILYNFLDNSDLFKGTVEKDSRSLMNVPFITGDEALDATFVKAAEKAGLVNLKGHRTVGGMRASIYNAMPKAGVEKLVEFMSRFELENR